MMREEFKEMSLAEQGMILISQGKHLTQMKKDNYLINLYSVNDFFVEVYYFIPQNQISKIEIVDDLSRIDQYIDEKRATESLKSN
jgi:hypothetical protein